MYTLLTLILAATLKCSASVSVTLDRPAEPRDPFARTEIVQQDVRLYVHIDRPADLRANVRNRPIGAWTMRVLQEGAFHDVWTDISRVAELDGGTFFDRYLGRELTVIVRGERTRPQWVALTRVQPTDAQHLLRQLRAKVHGPRHGAAIYELPEHDLLIALHGNTMLIGPAGPGRDGGDHDAEGLFDLTLTGLRIRPDETLADLQAITRARELVDADTSGQIGLYMRHEQPLGGWSVAVARLNDATLTLRHAASFEHAPWSGEITAIEFDGLSLLEGRAKPPHTMLAVVEPTDTGAGRLERFMLANLGHGLLDQSTRTMLGDRQVTLIGRPVSDGRVAGGQGDQREQPRASVVPAICRAWELGDDVSIDDADAAIRSHFGEVVQRVNRMTRGAFDLRVTSSDDNDDDRSIDHVDAGGLARAMFGDLPGIERTQLCWTVAAGPHGTWALLATDVDHLKQTATALTRRDDGDGAAVASRRDRWASCGFVDGRAIAEQLRVFMQHLAQQHAETASSRARSIEMMSEFAGSIESATWRTRRPARNEMRTDIEVRFTPPVTAGPPASPKR